MILRPMFAALIVATGLTAAVGVESSIETRYSQSDLVCSGSVVSVSAEDRPANGTEKLLPIDYKAKFETDRCYKGDSLRGSLTLSLPMVEAMAGPPVAAGWYVLVFLRKTNSGAFAIAAPSGGIVEFSWAKPLTPSTKAGLSLLQWDIAMAAKGSELKTPRTALAMLNEFGDLDAETFNELTGFKDQPDSDSKILRLTALAKFNRAAKTPDPVAAGSILRELAFVLKARGDSPPPNVAQVAFAIANDGTISDLNALEEITTSPIPYIRRSAMRGIRKLGAPKSVQFLVGQMMSVDLEVKYLAVITLAEIVGKNGEFAPAMDLFKRDPEKYTALWAAWWASDGTKHY